MIGRYYLMYKEENMLHKWTIYKTLLDISSFFIYTRELYHCNLIWF